MPDHEGSERKPHEPLYNEELLALGYWVCLICGRSRAYYLHN